MPGGEVGQGGAVFVGIIQSIIRRGIDPSVVKGDIGHVDKGAVTTDIIGIDHFLSSQVINHDTEYYFIIGADSLKSLVNWYRPDIIVKNCVLLVYPRGGTDDSELIRRRRRELNADIRPINAPRLDISSTELRERVRAGKSIRYFVPDDVYKFIRENKIYG